MKAFVNRRIIVGGLALLWGCAPKPILMDQTVKDSLSGIQEIKVYTTSRLNSPFLQADPMPMFIGGAIGGAVTLFRLSPPA